MIDPSNEQQLQQATLEDMSEWINFTLDPANRPVDPRGRAQSYKNLGAEFIRRLGNNAEHKKVLVSWLATLDQSSTYFYTLVEPVFEHTKEPRPWHTDVELWYQLADVLCNSNSRRLELPSRSKLAPGNTQRFSEWLRQQVEKGHYLPALHVIRGYTRYLVWPGMTTEQGQAVLDWVIAALNRSDIKASYKQVGIEHDIAKDLSPLFNYLDDQHLLALAAQSDMLRVGIFHNLRERSWDPGYDWTPWFDYMEANPNFYREFSLRDYHLIERLWPHASTDDKDYMVYSLVKMLEYWESQDVDGAAEVLERLLLDDSEPVVSYLKEVIEDGIGYTPLAQLIWKCQTPELVSILLSALAEYYHGDWYAPDGYDVLDEDEYSPHLLVQNIVSERPDLLTNVPGNRMGALLDMLSDEQLNRCLPELTKALMASSSKHLRSQLEKRADALQPEQIETCGWVNKPNKNLMMVARDVLLAHSSPKAGTLLETLLVSGKLDAGSVSQVEMRLIDLGLRDPLSGDDQLLQLEDKLASVKRIGKAVEQLVSPDLLARMAPLSAHAARAVLQLTHKADGLLPPLVNQALACLTAEQRAQLMVYVLDSWLASGGDPKQRWILLLLQGNADDRLVDTLFDTIKQWNKPKGLRAAMAVEHLASIDSPYALMRVQEVSETRRFRETVIERARSELQKAAERRSMTLDELFDELTPDFGLTQQVSYQIGEQTYIVQLQGDLSLRLINAKGKASKSVPKPRDASLLEQWEAAKANFKTLGNNLKTVIKRQGPRMQAAMIASKQWPLDRWQRLFLQHPLLQVVGRSLIWQTDMQISIRIAEDLSLVDVNDDPVVLTADSQIRLWHPLYALEGEQQQWQEYLADYELEPIVDQLNAPHQLPQSERMSERRLLAKKGLEVRQEQLASLLKKLGYRQGPVTDGPNIEDHYLRLEGPGLRVTLDHGAYPPYMDLGFEVEVYGISVDEDKGDYWSESMNPAELSPVLQAMLLDHLQQMEALAIAPDVATLTNTSNETTPA